VGIGITGSHFYQQEAQGAVGQGQSLHVAGFAISYGELSERQISQEQVRTEATVAVYRDNRHMATLWPASDYYPISRQVVTVPAVRSTLAGDLYVILVDWSQESAGTATLKVYYNPLMSWLWIGACLLTIGTAVAAWPERRDQAECAMAYRAGALAADG
jgi:cytochrome c-type biogenesis protein CcmF